jgi:hypothetical protein
MLENVEKIAWMEGYSALRCQLFVLGFKAKSSEGRGVVGKRFK